MKLETKKSSFVNGATEALAKDGRTAAETVSKGVGVIFQGLTSDFHQSLTEVNVMTSPAVQRILSLTRSGRVKNELSDSREIIVYAIFSKAFKGKITLTALDGDHSEVARTMITTEAATEDAQFLTFRFEELAPLELVEYYYIEIAK